MKYLIRLLLISLVSAVTVFSPSDLPGCGPFLPQAVFTDTRTPFLPDFYRGRLGVLHPTFGPKFLFVAYRYLSAQPMGDKEIEFLTSPPAPVSERELIFTGSQYVTPAAKEWLDVRNSIPDIGPSPQIEVYRNDSEGSAGGWRYFLNCSEDAFTTAAKTLAERKKNFGNEHPGIRNWVIAQDMVFSNCPKGEAIPAAAEPELPQVLKYDRTYQIAAAHFYSEHYDEAARLFRTIANDSRSPWSAIAPYLVARSFIRKGTVLPKYRTYDKEALMEAERELDSISHDSSRTFLHAIAGKMEAFVRLRLYPVEHIRSLAERLQKQTQGVDFEQDLVDYQYLLNHLNTLPEFSPEAARKSGDMTDWILTISSADSAHAQNQWKSTGSTAWLVAAMLLLHGNQAREADVLDAANRIPSHSPAFATVQYNRVRVMMESGRNAQARAALDELLPKLRTSLNNTSLNLFLSERLQLARNFNEFLEFAPRIPETPSGSGPPLFDEDSIKILNRALPLSLLARAASSGLPQNLKEAIVRAVWVRAVLTGDMSVANSLSGELRHFVPALESDLNVWITAKDTSSKQFASAMLMLHFPGTSPYLSGGMPPREKLDGIDPLRENWWCGFVPGGDLDQPTRNRYMLSRNGTAEKPPQPADSPAFLTDADRAEFMREWRLLEAVGAAPTYLGRIVVSWAENHPKDERVPEALHLVVKASRFGCTDSESSRYSRAAFRLLHSRYPDTEWTKSTPYWYR